MWHKVGQPHAGADNAYKVEGVADNAGGGPVVVAKAEPVLALLANADIAKGEQSAKVCATCHSFVKGGANAIGPGLWDVVNHDKGAHAGFAYSDALKNMDGTWSYASLNKFLWKPKAYVEGTKMNFVGLKKPEDRANVIAYLRTLSDSPAGLPSAAQIDAENAELAPPAADAPAADDAAPAPAAH